MSQSNRTLENGETSKKDNEKKEIIWILKSELSKFHNGYLSENNLVHDAHFSASSDRIEFIGTKKSQCDYLSQLRW